MGSNLALVIDLDRDVSMARQKRKWLLIQARIDPEDGREFKELARKMGLPASAYLRMLAMQHIRAMRENYSLMCSSCRAAFAVRPAEKGEERSPDSENTGP